MGYICSKAGLSEDLSASSLDNEQRISLLGSIEAMMYELEEGDWVYSVGQ